MLKFINRKIVFQWVLLLVLLVISVYTVSTRSQMADMQGNVFLYMYFANFFLQYPFLGKGIIILLLLLQIILLQFYFRKNEYADKNTLLPACIYLSILLLTNSLTIIFPFFFTLLFFLIIISIGNSISLTNIINSAFWSGVTIAVAACFDISSILLLILMAYLLIVNHFSKIREMGILCFGFTLVIFYFFAYYFFTNHLDEWIATFQQVRILRILKESILHNSLPIISLIVLGIIYTFFIVKAKLLSDVKVMVQRRRISIFNIFSIGMVACLFISNSAYPHILGYLFIPISIYLSIIIQEKNSFFYHEIITVLTLAALWV